MGKTDPQAAYRRSHQAFERARRVMVGGVNSPVRAYKAVGREPIFVAQGEGAHVVDVDGHRYIDYVGSYGPLILGHAAPEILTALHEAARHGTSFGMPTEREIELAEMVAAAVPSIEVVRLVNSGTEATMSALRLARAATGRPKIIKCTGCYHGHSDALLVQAGSGATTLGTPSSPGVPTSVTEHTVLVPYNDQEAVAAAFKMFPGQIAAMIVEPIAGNMGCVPPLPGYLEALRELCDAHGALLVFDEVMSGFRVALGGAQTIYGVTPDLTCLGKVIGGGLPVGAYGGREDLMRQVSPDGPVYQAGTLSGNPLAVAAGIAALTVLRDTNVYDKLELSSALLVQGLEQAAEDAGVKIACTRVGSMVCPFFRDEAPNSYEEATTSDTKAFSTFFAAMLDGGVVLPPSQYETWFVSRAHTEDVIEKTVKVAAQAFARVAESRG